MVGCDIELLILLWTYLTYLVSWGLCWAIMNTNYLGQEPVFCGMESDDLTTTNMALLNNGDLNHRYGWQWGNGDYWKPSQTFFEFQLNQSRRWPSLTSEKDGSYLERRSAIKNYSILTGAFPRQIAALCPAVSLASTWEQKWQVSQDKIQWISKVPEVFCGVSMHFRENMSFSRWWDDAPHKDAHWGAEWLGIQVWWDLHYSHPSNCRRSAVAGSSKSPISFHRKATTAPPGGLCWSRSWYGALGISFEHLWTTSKLCDGRFYNVL